MLNIGHYYRNADQNYNEVFWYSGFMPVRMTILKKSKKKKKMLERVWRKGNSHTVGGNAKWYNHYGEE